MMTLSRHELTTLVTSGAILGFSWIVSAIFTLVSTDRVQLAFFVGQGFGPLQTDTIDTVWNSTTGFAGFSLFATFAIGAYLTAHFRTYLGSGVTRRETYRRLVVIGFLVTTIATMMVGAFWGLSALAEMPEIRGVSPVTLATIPLGQLVAYSLGAFSSSLFVRFTWWKVVIALAVVQILVTGGSILVDRFVQPFAIDLSSAQTMGILMVIVTAAWAVAWPLLRDLPVRRS